MAKKLSVFLLIGQSNMAGRGNLEDVPVLSHPEVYLFRDNSWMDAVEPLHTDKPKIPGVGLGMSFAIELLRRGFEGPIGLVPCAVGGTSLDQWSPETKLYTSSVMTTVASLISGELAGILWHQGEGDSNDADLAKSYQLRFCKLIKKLRSDLSADSIPVLAGELGAFLEHREGVEYYEQVNQQLRESGELIPNYACVSADGLSDKGDSLHFNAVSLREFGIRYAATFQDINGFT